MKRNLYHVIWLMVMAFLLSFGIQGVIAGTGYHPPLEWTFSLGIACLSAFVVLVVYLCSQM